MSIRKEPSGRFRAVLKSGRQHVTSKTFDTKREATEWLSRERAALVGGIDPRAGRVRTRALVAQWLEVREVTVANKTYRTDQDLLRLMPMSMQNMGVAAISAREVSRSFESLIKQGLAESSVVRYRASLSSFFSWCVRERFITSNPVSGVRVPKSSAERVEMSPWSEAELEARYLAWKKYDERLADILVVMGWTGLRWAEARALTVGDIALGDSPALRVQRSDPEGVGVKSTKGRRSRRVPLRTESFPSCCRSAVGSSRPTCSSRRAPGASSTVQQFSALSTGRPLAKDAASTTYATRLPASGWPAASTLGPFSSGWATSPSPPRTATFITSAPPPKQQASRDSMGH